MPPHYSFGIGAVLCDPDGRVIAALSNELWCRPGVSDKNSYRVYACKPQFPGQEADDRGRYLWADCRRNIFGVFPPSNAVAVTDGAGAPAFTVRFPSRGGYSTNGHRVTVQRANGDGVMLLGPTAGERLPRHGVQCAAGGDPILYLCIIYACYLAEDEIWHATQEAPGTE